jgi:hypothetical protein
MGLKSLLLIVAVVLFVLAALTDTRYADYLAWGLACTAGALLVEALGLGGINLGGSRRRG